MEILKNFKLAEGKWEEFPFIKILPGEDVFAGLPVCKMAFQAQFTQPVIVVRDGDIPLAFELEELKKKLEKTRRFFLVADEKGVLKEVEQKDAKIVLRLPLDTKINELVYIDGQVLKQEVNE
jgi:hypothetical protein